MNIFKDFWKNLNKTHDTLIQEELNDVKEDVHEMDERLDQYEDAAGHRKKNTVHITYDRNGVPVNSYVDETTKGIFPSFQVSKPGPSIHTAEWDRCVREVSSKNPDANAFAVCTAQLGESSFKSEYRNLGYVKSLIQKARKAMGTGFAGSVPNSLLARQDLEGEDRTKNIADDTKLYQLATDSRQVDTEGEKEDVVDKIKEVQVKRQKAALKDRGVTKSFKSFWNTFKP